MKKIIAIQSNNLKTINPLTDTSLQLAIEAQKRGFKVFWYEAGLSLPCQKVNRLLLVCFIVECRTNLSQLGLPTKCPNNFSILGFIV